jgi:hypothetical protein
MSYVEVGIGIALTFAFLIWPSPPDPVKWGGLALGLGLIFHGWRKAMEPWHLIAAGLFTATVGILWQQFWWQKTQLGVVDASPKFVDTQLRLQFFGDDRFPEEISATNISSWFAYRTPTMGMAFTGADGKPLDGSFSVPPQWVLFVVLKSQTDYRRVAVSFSDPKAMPMTEVRQTTEKSIVISANSQFPAGVLEMRLSNDISR